MTVGSVASEFLVLSVRPLFAEAIVDRRKTIEIRRQRPNVKPGTLGLVYSPSPMQAVVGSFRVDIFSLEYMRNYGLWHNVVHIFLGRISTVTSQKNYVEL